MKRVCEPELLDGLPVGHPDAAHSRRDLRIINRLMRNEAWFVQTLPGLLRPGERVLELGSGTGELGRRLMSQGVELDGLDLWPRPAFWPSGRRWHQADLRGFSSYEPYAAVIGNLIFHQFTNPELGELGARLRRSARLILACEPARRRASQRLVALLAPLFGANPVTRHDARVSIAAGFVGDELPASLGIQRDGWTTSCAAAVLGAVRMVAVRSA
jgi:hypothetical protein